MARQCSFCGTTITLFGSKKVYGKDFLVCSDCESKRYELMEDISDAEYEEGLSFFLPVLSSADTPNEIKELFDLAQKRHERFRKKRLERFNGNLPKFEFKTGFSTLVQNYTCMVYVFQDRVVINRLGKLNGLPGDVTIYFRDVTSIQYASAQMGMRPRISLTVPGSAMGSTTMAAPMTKNLTVASTNVNHYDDPCSIIFPLDPSEEAKKYCEMIKQYYNEYKANEQVPLQVATIIQQESAVDKLKKLKELKDMGILSDSEYEEKRQKLLYEV